MLVLATCSSRHLGDATFGVPLLTSRRLQTALLIPAASETLSYPWPPFSGCGAYVFGGGARCKAAVGCGEKQHGSPGGCVAISRKTQFR